MGAQEHTDQVHDDQRRLLDAIAGDLHVARDDPSTWSRLAFVPGIGSDGRPIDSNRATRFRVLWAAQYDPTTGRLQVFLRGLCRAIGSCLGFVLLMGSTAGCLAVGATHDPRRYSGSDPSLTMEQVLRNDSLSLPRCELKNLRYFVGESPDPELYVKFSAENTCVNAWIGHLKLADVTIPAPPGAPQAHVLGEYECHTFKWCFNAHRYYRDYGGWPSDALQVDLVLDASENPSTVYLRVDHGS